MPTLATGPRRALTLCLAVSSFVPLVAEARPFTAGVGVGRMEAERDWDGEADSTLQLFGRVGLTRRVSVQLELQKIEGTYEGATVRTGTALFVVEVGQSGRLVPTMFAGLGIDRGDDSYGYSQKGSHIEGGLGLEYRFDGGLSLMADVRLGGRSIEDGDTVSVAETTGVSALYAPALIEGEYRSIRLGVAIRL